MAGYNKNLVFASACMGMLIFGIVMAVLGSLLPSLIDKFNIDLIDAGSLFLVMNLGILAGSMIFGPLVDRYGYKGLLAVCAFLVFAALQGIAHAPSLVVLQAFLFITGFAGGSINGGTNALVSDISGENRGAGLTFLGVFFGIGALGVPFILGTLLDRFSYEALTSFVGALILLPFLLFSFIRFPLPKHSQGFALSEGLKLTRQTTLLLFGLLLFMQSGLEMTVGGWSAAFLNEEFAIGTRQAVLFLSFYWLGLIVARLVLTWLLEHIENHIVMIFSILIAVAGSILLLLSHNPLIAVTGLFLTGIGFAAIFPLVFAYVGSIYPEYSGTAFGVILAIALLGGMAYPFIAGILAEAFSIRAAMLLVPFTLVLAGLLFGNLYRRIKAMPRG
jgi:MFS transporter, FHS family, glucose/mannose:H+ symporter